MLTPLLDQCPGLFHRAENLTVKQLISELAVEAFIVPVRPAIDPRSIASRSHPMGYLVR